MKRGPKAVVTAIVDSSKRSKAPPSSILTSTTSSSSSKTEPFSSVSSEAIHPESAKYLIKSEPDEFSIDDLAARTHQRSPWDGIRNAQAKNTLKGMKIGDQAFFYHSSCGKLAGIYGEVKIVREAFEDETAADPAHKYYDAKAARGKWVAVEVELVEKWGKPLLLSTIKELAATSTPTATSATLSGLVLLKNSRLSVQALTEDQWNCLQTIRTTL